MFVQSVGLGVVTSKIDARNVCAFNWGLFYSEMMYPLRIFFTVVANGILMNFYISYIPVLQFGCNKKTVNFHKKLWFKKNKKTENGSKLFSNSRLSFPNDSCPHWSWIFVHESYNSCLDSIWNRWSYRDIRLNCIGQTFTYT